MAPRQNVQNLDLQSLDIAAVDRKLRIGKALVMNGSELKAWRKLHGYTQEELMRELDVKSRQTIINWERCPGKLPRMLELSLKSLEKMPEEKQYVGRKSTAKEVRLYNKKNI